MVVVKTSRIYKLVNWRPTVLMLFQTEREIREVSEEYTVV